jgi:uncharacterized protein YbjT (DUF2867 family)
LPEEPACSGAGLQDRLSGYEVVVNVANVVTTGAKAAVDFFSRTTGNLLDVARRTGIKHVITLSIVGCDEVNFGYYMGKRAQEEVVRGRDLPWTVLRATQFFEFPEPLLDDRSPVVLIPNMLTRPVAARDVAKRFVDRPGPVDATTTSRPWSGPWRPVGERASGVPGRRLAGGPAVDGACAAARETATTLRYASGNRVAEVSRNRSAS